MSLSSICWSACIGLALAGSCTPQEHAPAPTHSGQAPLTPASTRQAAAPRQQTPTTPAVMREHDSEARAMRKAAIAGQLEELRRVAASIATEAWTPNLRPDYRPHFDAVRAAASSARTASSLSEAALALGALGEACAACHRSVGGPAQPVPGPAAATEDAMAAHAAAEGLLWYGLSTPSDASWQRGADALLKAPSLDSDVEEVSALAHRTSQLAQAALEAQTDRGAAYGRILSGCSGCHRAVDVGRAP